MAVGSVVETPVVVDKSRADLADHLLKQPITAEIGNDFVSQVEAVVNNDAGLLDDSIERTLDDPDLSPSDRATLAASLLNQRRTANS